MRYVFSLILVLVFSAGASAQTAEVTVSTDRVPTVKIWHPAFEAMCQNLSKKLNTPEGTGRLTLKPQVTLASEIRQAGRTWVVETQTGHQVEIQSAELPEVLRVITGASARTIVMGSCYLRSNHFFSKQDVVFVTASDADAQMLARAIK